MLELVNTGVTSVMSWIGTVVDAMLTETGALKEIAPLFAIGIACSAVFLGIKAIKSVTWGA